MFVHATKTSLAFLVAALVAHTVPAAQIKLDVALGHSVLKADKKQTDYLRVGLRGFKLRSKLERTPVNVAIVIDRSGSMQGEKIRKAKEAAIMVVKRLTSRDIASVIAYSDTANILVPATKLTNKEPVIAALNQLEAGGSTALFAGVSQGAGEVRKFLDRTRVNRIILLSDGIANVGPSSPAELGGLGASLIKESISVTTIGLGSGYNEDLMSTLAQKSDGNHYFAENATDLARVFNGELGDVLSVVAQEVLITIRCAEGIRPVRVLGRPATITGQMVTVLLNQVYSEQEKYVLLEIEVPATPHGRVRSIANVSVSYANMQTKTTDRLTSAVSARFSGVDAEVEKSTNKIVMVAAVEQIAVNRNEMAVKLRDQGKIKEAQELLLYNGAYLRRNGTKYNSKALLRYGRYNDEDAKLILHPKRYSIRRKKMVEEQVIQRTQRKR